MGGGWFHSGDAAVVHPDGYVEIRDRIKDVIISGGENISSVEVEGVLLRHPAVAEAAIVGLPHEKWGEAPRAFMVLRDGEQASEEEIIAFARDRLAHFKAPREVSFVSGAAEDGDGQDPEVRSAFRRPEPRAPVAARAVAAGPGRGGRAGRLTAPKACATHCWRAPRQPFRILLCACQAGEHGPGRLGRGRSGPGQPRETRPRARPAARGRTGAGRVTNVELFFDLVYVFAVTQLSHFLLGHQTIAGVLQTALLLTMVWLLWIYTTWVTNWLDPERRSGGGFRGAATRQHRVWPIAADWV